MSDPDKKPRRNRRIAQAVAGTLLIAGAIWVAWFLTSGGFRETVRRRVVSRLEEMTGGRVELRDFSWNLSKLEFVATGLTIHGLEGADVQPPYAHVDRLFVRAKIISLVQREIGLAFVDIQRPVIHIIVYPDGTTNQPKPRSKDTSASDPIQRIFDLAIEKVQLSSGTLIWNERRIPLEFTGNDLSLSMSYIAPEQRYEVTLRMGKTDTVIKDLRPFASTANIELAMVRSGVQIRSLEWKSGDSYMHVSGTIEDFNQPKLALNYDGSFNLAQVSAITRNPEVRSGTLELRGSGTLSANDFFSTGSLSVKAFNYRNSDVKLSDASANGDFSVSPQRITISRIAARLLGGTANGDAVVEDWISLPQNMASKRGVPGDREPKGRASLRIEGASVGEVAKALSNSRVPLDRLNAVGTASGPIQGEWRGSLRDLRASGDLTIVPPATAAENQMPVEGNFSGTYRLRSRTLEITEANLRTRAAELRASGMLGSAFANVTLDANARSIAEFRPLIDAIRGSEPLPIDVGGSLQFRGSLGGRFSQPTIQGHLELRDFETVLPRPTLRAATNAGKSTQTQPLRVHWDSLSGDVLYSPTQVSINRGVLRRGAAQANLDASVTLSVGNYHETLPFTGRFNVRGLDAAELLSLIGYNYPIRGTLNANFQVGGTQNDPRGNGRFTLTDGSIYGQPVRSISADLSLLHREAQLRNLVALADSGQLRGTASYNLSTEQFQVAVKGNDFKLAQFPQIQMKRMRLEGIGNFEAQGSGTLQEPNISANIVVTKVLLNGERIGDLTARGTTHGSDLRIDAISSFQHAALKLNGNIRLRDDYPARLDMTFGDIDMNPLIKSYLADRLTGHTTIAGTMRLAGPLKRPRELNGELNIDRLLANLENIAIHNDGPVRVSMAAEQLRIERFRLVGEETHFIEASGTAQLGGSQRLNLKVAGKLNMKLLQTFSRDIAAYGTSEFGVDVAGTLKKPQLNGRAQIANAGISYIDLPNGLSGINGTLIFTQDRLQVESLTAKTGGGELVLGGFITYQRALTFNLTARGSDIRLRYPPGVSSTADANLTLSGTLKNSLLSGEITVTKFGINPRFDFGLYLAQQKQAQQTPALESPLNGLKFDVHVISTPELEVQTSLAKISGDVDLRLRGTAARPSVLGRVNIVEGDVWFNGTQYHLERGDVTFTNPVKIEPVLDLEATAHVRDYDITLGFHGPTEKLSTTYRSDPPLPTADIIALLALGRTREESVVQSMNTQQSNTMLTESASNALLGQALNATVSSRVQKLFGVSRIKIDPQVGGPENNPNARLTIEQSVSNKITLTYITNLSQSAQQIIQVEYNINKNISILGVRDQNGVVGFDVRIRQRKK